MNRQNEGFTLVEILVALTILSITMGAYLTHLNQQITQTHVLKNRTLGHWVAQNHLAQLRIEAQWPSTGSHTFKVQQGQQIWQLSQLVSNTPNPSIRRVAIKTADHAGDYSGTLVGYLNDGK